MERNSQGKKAQPLVDSAPAYWVYLVECADGTLYTGCARDVEQRVAAHNAGQGAKYTRSRLPVRVVYVEAAVDRGSALRREAESKKMGREEKVGLIGYSSKG